jgi:glycosyltransferase involved in cell wall biosynthesis
MTIKPFFSVVIPTYNRADKLRNTLAAILNQKFSDFEVIVMDDGGEDETDEVINSLNDKRFTYFKKKNSGPLLTRAEAAEKAKGDWIAFCDSDDIWRDDYLQSLYEIAKNKTIDNIFSDYLVEGEQCSRISKLNSDGFFQEIVKQEMNDLYILKTNDFFLRLLEVQPIMISAFAIKRDFYEAIGGIDKSIEVIGSEDSDLTLRASALGITAYSKKCSVKLGRGNDNVSDDYIRNLEGGTEILTKILSKGDVPEIHFKSIQSAIDRQFLEIAEQYYWNRNFSSSVKNLKKTKLSFERLGRKFKLLGKLFFRFLQSKRHA